MKQILPLVLLLTGCIDIAKPSHDELHRVWCLKDVSAENADIIQDAMTEWNERSDMTTWSIGTSGCDGFIVGMHEVPGKTEWAAETHYRDSIYFETDFTGAPLYHIMLHELGHVASLNHSDNPDDIMYYAVTDVAHLSDGDIAQFHVRNDW